MTDRLRETLKKARIALTHDSPTDCWAEGPSDLKHPEHYDHSCPGCVALHAIDAALAEPEMCEWKEQPSGDWDSKCGHLIGRVEWRKLRDYSGLGLLHCPGCGRKIEAKE